MKTREYYNEQVKGPGKFEGEPGYVLYFWEKLMDGFSDDDDGEVASFNLTTEDYNLFPELIGSASISVWESDTGFVYHSLE